jgi:hypothetical protein
VARASLSGSDLHVTLDFDPHAPPPTGTPTLVLLSGDAHTKPVELPMRWEDEERVGAHFVLPGTGTWHPVVKLGDRVFRAAPVTLPWAPEFEPAPAMAGLFSDAVESMGTVPLAPLLAGLALAALLAEVFVRRFTSGPKRVKPKKVAPKPRASAPGVEAWLARTSAPRAAGPTAMPQAPKPPPAPEPEAAPPPPAAPEAPKAPSVADALAQARERAKKRTGR